MIRVSAETLELETDLELEAEASGEVEDGLRDESAMAVDTVANNSAVGLLACHYIEVPAGELNTAAVYVRGVKIELESIPGTQVLVWESIAFLNGEIIFSRKPSQNTLCHRRYAIEEAVRAVASTLAKLSDGKRAKSPEKEAAKDATKFLQEIIGMTGNEGIIGEPREWLFDTFESVAVDADGEAKPVDEIVQSEAVTTPAAPGPACGERKCLVSEEIVVTFNQLDTATEQSQIEFEEEIAALEQIVIAAMLRRMDCEAKLKNAKSDEKAAAKELQAAKARGPETFPLFEGQKSSGGQGDENSESPSTPQATGEAGPVASTEATVEATTAAAVSDAWRAVSIDELRLPPKLTERLVESGIATIGQLEDQRGKGSIHGSGLREVEGIGAKKAEQIEEAVLNWLTVNRDREALKATN